MRCPHCGAPDSQVKDSRPTEDDNAIRRRRVCPSCTARFTTFERVQLRELTVIKREDERETFDREKLRKSLNVALRKRPVSSEQLDAVVSAIVRELEGRGEPEVRSKEIGALAMAQLKALDKVGYVRYASVYRDFREPGDFRQAVDELAADPPYSPGTAAFQEPPPRSGRRRR